MFKSVGPIFWSKGVKLEETKVFGSVKELDRIEVTLTFLPRGSHTKPICGLSQLNDVLSSGLCGKKGALPPVTD